MEGGRMGENPLKEFYYALTLAIMCRDDFLFSHLGLQFPLIYSRGDLEWNLTSLSIFLDKLTEGKMLYTFMS